MDNKPGYLTTEFWLSIITVAAILLKVFGIDLNTEDAQALAVAIVTLLGGFLAVWGIVSRYIRSRAEVKKTEANVQLAKLAMADGKPVTLNLGAK